MATIRQEIQEVDRSLEISDIRTITQLLDQALVQERLLAKLSSFFSLLALLLACIGLYGVMSYDVARRRHEIGIRMALGATGQSVQWLVLRQSLTVVFVGIALGVSFVPICTRLIGSFLYGLSSTDPVAIILSTLLLILVALLACYIPARRAARVDPSVALRYE